MIEHVTPSPVVEFATPVHQEQIASEQTVHFPILHIQGQIVEGVHGDPPRTSLRAD